MLSCMAGLASPRRGARRVEARSTAVVTKTAKLEDVTAAELKTVKLEASTDVSKMPRCASSDTNLSEADTAVPMSRHGSLSKLTRCSSNDTNLSDLDTMSRVGSLSTLHMPEVVEEEGWKAQDEDDEIRSTTTCSDLERWSDPEETLIIFDWDDTLCPTSAAQFEDQDAALLQGHACMVEQVLRVAAGLGHVEIVTMATKSWVERTIADLLPGLRDVLEELGVRIRSASDDAPPREQRAAAERGRDKGHYLKRRIMHKVIRKFYRSRADVGLARSRPQRSWKNILSVGDSLSERLALQDLVFGHAQRDRRGRWKECRCKVVKLMGDPTVMELAAQLLKLGESLPAFVSHDGDLDINFDDEDVRQAVEYLEQHC